MTFHDMVSIALLMIRRQKTRTALSLIGVVIGSLMLLFSLAARRGVQDAVSRIFSMNREMRQIDVFRRVVHEKEVPAKELEVDGEMDEAMRSRIRKRLGIRWRIEHSGVHSEITSERIERIEALEHVQSVRPTISLYVGLVHGDNELQGTVKEAAAGDEVLRERIVAGKAFGSDSDQTILLNEFVAWRWGYISHAQMGKLVGTKVRLDFRHGEDNVASSIAFRRGGDIEFSKEEIIALNSALDRIPTIIDELSLSEQERAAMKKAFPSSAADRNEASESFERITSQEFTVAGIFRGPTEDERVPFAFFGVDAEFLLPVKTATQFALRTPYTRKTGFSSAKVLVDHESHLDIVSEQIHEMGFSARSRIWLVELIQKRIREVTLIVSLIAVFALVTSALGIANTMVMSVVERTREIGIMKALGAREGQIQMLFLTEGAMLGLIGGVCALVVGLMIRIPIESLTISILESEINETFEQEHLFEFPLWLLAVVLVFSTMVVTLATILPARRAAWIDPVAALRYD